MPVPARRVPEPTTQISLYEKLGVAKQRSETVSKRVKCCSTTLVVLGALGVVKSIYSVMTAYTTVQWLVKMAKSGWKKPEQGEAPEYGPVASFDKDHANEPVTQIELEFYDLYKNMMILMGFFSMIVLFLGKAGRWVVWRKKAGFTHRIFRKSIFMLLPFLMIVVALK